MAYYRLYSIDAAGRFLRFDEFDAADDVAATAMAQSLRGETAAELWERGRLVKALDKLPADAIGAS